MQIQTVLLIILAAVVDLSIVLFQYYKDVKKRGRTGWLLSFLRFCSFFGLLLLIINPKMVKNEYSTRKTDLVVLTDNSSSVQEYRAQLENILSQIERFNGLNDRFSIHQYAFDKSLNNLDSLTYEGDGTDINRAVNEIEQLHSDSKVVTLLLTDGNQTSGQDYGFFKARNNFAINTIAVGDTTHYDDLAISQVNANRFAFLNNKFPIEIFTDYTGSSEVNTQLTIQVNGSQVFRQSISFNRTKRSEAINTLIDARSVGLKNIKVSLTTLPNEKFVENNTREVGVEVIDEKTQIAIISNWEHPDIGTLKKSIESNEQRSLSIYKTNDVGNWKEADLFILYQPDASYKPVYDLLQKNQSSVFTVTGSQTDWNFLNSVQNSFSKEGYDQTEDISPILNQGFSLFDLGNFSVEDYPPLRSTLGEIQIIANSQNVLTQSIKGVELDEPLLTVFENNQQRQAVLFGEDLWKWRMASFKRNQSFEDFDQLISKIILYLASNGARERLTLDYPSVFDGSNEARIYASYFDNAFVFNRNANIVLKVTNSASNTSVEIPFLLKESNYEADLSNLSPGQYKFSVSVEGENLSKSGQFSILDFDIEKQFAATDYQKLSRLAMQNSGNLYFTDQVPKLLEELESNPQYVPTQTSNQNVVSLIDFRILLALIALTLAAEWFIRKYIGLI